MTNPIQAIRGMNDCLPPDTFHWQYVEATLRTLLTSYGFHEIRMPILEKTELFKRTIGEATDIVEKEMYTFADRNNDNLTLRPEGTASCVRAGIEHGLFYNQIQKLWYLGPYFRYERPQKGRYRQFHQCGVEMTGVATPDSDAELIALSARIIKLMGLSQHVELQINSLGSPDSRAAYRVELVRYFNTHHDQLDEDSQRRLLTNPLRILDSKNPALAELIQHAPKLTEHLDPESEDHFNQLQVYLQGAGIAYTVNPCLVRGLDYYTKTVFEWVTTELGAQGTVIAGGRYDGLIEQLGGKATPALGFAMGMERLILLLQQLNTLPPPPAPDFYVMTEGSDAYTKALTLADSLRDAFPASIVLVHCGSASLKNQFKKADKSGARFAITLGENEIAQQSVILKNLRERHPQELIHWNQLESHLQTIMQGS